MMPNDDTNLEEASDNAAALPGPDVKQLSGLASAHRGYVHQDVSTAYFLAKAIVDGAESITVDRKLYKGDVFDDLTIKHSGRTVRRQFKSSADANKPFAEEALKTKTSDLRIDDIVRCICDAGEHPADEYRICVTWSVPFDPEIARLLLPCSAQPSFDGYATKLYRLHVGLIWPENGNLIWKLRGGVQFSRNELASVADKLIVELECPQISLDLAAPGPLQVLLRDLLTERIGIGRYPNRNIRGDDAAIRLIHRASLARAGQESLTPKDVVRDLNLRTDFGRVAQKFPVVKEKLVSRQSVIDALSQHITTRQRILVVGAPGSGKSWILTQLADDLAANGSLVIRHYCYLEPGDEFVERRITVDVLFGNLVAELIDADPGIQCDSAARFAAGPKELEELLAEAQRRDPERRIVLMVDGLDHIERIGAEAHNVARTETRIVEELANVKLPVNACVMMGSQPGIHLAAFHSPLTKFQLGGWSEGELHDLADRLGALRRVREVFGEEEVEGYVAAIHERSEGNPLYATYLCRETRQAIESGVARDPVDDVLQTPAYDGDLNNYYKYLVGTGIPDFASSILAYIDFSVTRQEFAEIYPVIAPQLDGFLTRLAPVITDVTGQGGLRVYHESFRRFIVDSLSNHRQHRDDVLEQISGWLHSKGFYQDHRAFRHLLEYLLRQSRHSDVLTHIDVAFVSSSIANGHSAEHILNNIAIAAKSAASMCDWASLCRLSEVRKAVDNLFENELDYEAYTSAFVSVGGAERLADQLIFDGKPTRSKDEGLIACAQCDNFGSTPPWREYLAIDGSHSINERESAAIAEFLGQARLSNADEICNSVIDWFRRTTNAPTTYVHGVLRELSRVHGIESVLGLDRANDLPNRARFHIHLAASKLEWTAGNKNKAANHANDALAFAEDAEDIAECLQRGAATSGYSTLPDVEQLTKSVVGLSYPDEKIIHEWISAIRFIAFCDPARLDRIRGDIVVDGWYRAWMHFCISVSLAVPRSRIVPREGETIVVSALEELAREDSPFRGSPRACDLYSIRDDVYFMWCQAVELIEQSETLENAIELLSQISESTTSYLQGTPSGPLTMEDVVSIAETRLPHPAVVRLFERQVERAEAGLYPVQAPLELKLTKAYMAARRTEDGKQRWTRACQCITAYRERRDITVYELINSVKHLATGPRALVHIGELQRLVESLDGRTDGKDTQGALVQWFEELARLSPAQAAILLARSLIQRGGVISWRLEESLCRILSQIQHAREDILLALWFTTQSELELQQIPRILGWISNLIRRGWPDAESAFRRLQARFQNKVNARSLEGVRELQEFALVHGFDLLLKPEPKVPEPDAVNIQLESSASHSENEVAESVFPSNASVLDISRSLKNLGRGAREQPDRVIDALGYSLVQLADVGRIDDATWLIVAFATETTWETKAMVLSGLGEGLERYKQPQLAALAFALAGWNCRTEYPLMTDIDDMHLGFIEKAMTIDVDRANRAIADEVARGISTADGYFFGITARVIQLVSRFVDAGTAFSCWSEAYRAIKHRLPEWQDIRSVFLHYESAEFPDWSVDEALAYVLIARISHPDLERKQYAITGIAEVLFQEPEVLNKGLQLALDRDTPLTSVLLILSALLDGECPPYVCSRHIAHALQDFRHCGLYAIRHAAERLLSRIT